MVLGTVGTVASDSGMEATGGTDAVIPLPVEMPLGAGSNSTGSSNSDGQPGSESVPSTPHPTNAVTALAGGIVGSLVAAANADPGEAEPALFSDLQGRSEPRGSVPGRTSYALRTDLGVPSALMRERMPDADHIDGLARIAAEEFEIDDRVMRLLIAPDPIDVVLRVRELLMGSGAVREDRVAALPSPAKIATAAQRAFDFNEDIDPRTFRSALVERFAGELRRRGTRGTDHRLMGSVIDTIAVFQPARIRAAVRRAMARQVEPVEGEPIPAEYWDEDGLHRAERGVYGVFPSGMNGPERRFAEWLDRTEGVRWWLRNPSASRNRWAVRLMLASGHGFHPDFVIGVEGRRTVHNILLAEVKDDGEDGRLHADRNVEKIETRHRDYLDVLFVTEGEGGAFHRLSFQEVENRIAKIGQLSSTDLRRS